MLPSVSVLPSPKELFTFCQPFLECPQSPSSQGPKRSHFLAVLVELLANVITSPGSQRIVEVFPPVHRLSSTDKKSTCGPRQFRLVKSSLLCVLAPFWKQRPWQRERGSHSVRCGPDSSRILTSSVIVPAPCLDPPGGIHSAVSVPCRMFGDREAGGSRFGSEAWQTSVVRMSPRRRSIRKHPCRRKRQ